MIRGAVLYIGNDSAGIHIAAMYQIPSICIRPGYYKGQFLPYIEDVEIGQEPEEMCIRDSPLSWGRNWEI